MDDQVFELMKCEPNIIGQVYTDLAQPSVKAVGTALGTVFELSNTILLPIRLLNEKCKLIVKKRLDDYSFKLMQIPPEKRCVVHPQLGIPILEKLSYTTNDEIADLFTTLLANASNKDLVNMAHPSFVTKISSLLPDEARIICYLKGKEEIQYCNFLGNAKDGIGHQMIKEYLTLIPKEINLDFPDDINAYFANLVSLGILFDKVDEAVVDQTEYNKIKELYGFEELESKLVPNKFKSLEIHNSFYKVTELGKLFIQACIK